MFKSFDVSIRSFPDIDFHFSNICLFFRRRVRRQSRINQIDGQGMRDQAVRHLRARNDI